ncbi:O-methyltransferase [Actinomycetota bacterium]|nr:O-methyltransferase [Actinomycetota bacterium]
MAQMEDVKNAMMDRPIVQEDVLNFLRTGQGELTGKLKELQDFAIEGRMPIIPKETVSFLRFFLPILNPKRILEVGTCIGFSAGLMASVTDAQIVTIDRYKLMIDRARKNFEEMGYTDRITLLEGDAEMLLPALDSTFDFIFLDCAKSKYIKFLPDCLRLMNPGAVLVIDDIFQAGTIFDDPELVRHKRRKIYEGLNELLNTVYADPTLTATSLPLGDGLLLVRSNREP